MNNKQCEQYNFVRDGQLFAMYRSLAYGYPQSYYYSELLELTISSKLNAAMQA